MKRVSSFTVIVAFVCLALVGVALIPLLPVKLNPSRSLPGFTVGFSMPGTSSRVVEMEVTSKLESMLARIRGVKRLNSTSGNGYGNITVELDKHADVEAVRFEASTIIRQTYLIARRCQLSHHSHESARRERLTPFHVLHTECPFHSDIDSAVCRGAYQAAAGKYSGYL